MKRFPGHTNPPLPRPQPLKRIDKTCNMKELKTKLERLIQKATDELTFTKHRRPELLARKRAYEYVIELINEIESKQLEK